MATITLRVDVEVKLINAGIERRTWAEYTNNAVLEALEKGGVHG